MDGRDNISVEEWMERKLWTPGCVYGETCFLFETVAAIFPAGFPLTWWRMALSTVSFVVGTRIDHRFAIQTELNDGPYSLSALRFISRFTPPRPSFPPPRRRYFSPPPSLPPPKQYPFRSRVHLSVIFREREKRERKKEKKNARVVSTVCKSSDQSGSEDRGERTRERT